MGRAVNFRGIVLGNPLSFCNHEEGFHQLLLWVKRLLESHHLTTVNIGMEPTGHYWLNLAKWLSEHHIEIVLVNPHLVKKNKENRDNTHSKSDMQGCSRHCRYGEERLLCLHSYKLGNIRKATDSHVQS